MYVLQRPHAFFVLDERAHYIMIRLAHHNSKHALFCLTPEMHKYISANTH